LKQFNVKDKGFLYLPEHSLVFARILKCANTSIKTSLSNLMSTKNVQYARQNRILEPTNDLFWRKCTKQARWLKPYQYTALCHSMTSFTLIRNPLCRLQFFYGEKVLMNKIFPTMKGS